MLARSHRNTRLLAVLVGFLLLLALPATGPAQAPGVAALKQKRAALAARSQAAVVELYGLESRLAQSRSDLARVDAQAAALAREQAVVRRQLRAARVTVMLSQRQLGERLRYLYEQGPPDPIAVFLGATSLEEAIAGLEAAKQATRATQSVLEQSRSARRAVIRVRAQLAVKVRRTKEVRSRLAATAAGLEQARAERAAYLASLRREQELTAAQIGRLEEQARQAQQKAQQVQRQAVAAQAAQPAPAQPPAAAPGTTTGTEAATTAAPSTPPAAPVESISTETTPAPTAAPPPARPGGTMRVYATGYCLRGTTATGLPVGPGIVATDPTVIPLGTRMTIPGYGEGVAADTGGAIVGARIDVWIADCGKAAAFTRSVTITFH